MNEHYTFMVTATAEEALLESRGAVCIDDNGGEPDGNALLPIERISQAEARMAGVLDKGIMVAEVFRGSARELLRFAHGEDVDLADLDDDTIEDEAWSIAQNIATYYTRYSASDIIVCATDLPVE